MVRSSKTNAVEDKATHLTACYPVQLMPTYYCTCLVSNVPYIVGLHKYYTLYADTRVA